MTDLEKAVSKWLPHIWTPGKKCHVGMPACRHQGKVQWFDETDPNRWKLHDIPCPPATPELGFRLLDAMRAKMVVMLVLTSDMCTIVPYPTKRHVLPTFEGEDPDILTAIIKAAAALAEKDQ